MESSDAQDQAHRREDGSIIREAENAPVTEVAKKHGVSDQTIYLWRKRFGTMGVDDAKRLKSLEAENAKLEKLLVDRMLDIEVLKKDINAKNGDRARSSLAGGPRAQALEAAAPASTLLSVARSSARYASKREVTDAPVVKRMRELAAQYPRYGYRRSGSSSRATAIA